MLSDPEAEDRVWKALADPTRRALLDRLAKGRHTTGELAAACEPLSRTNVMKHLEVLVEAGLVVVRRDGRVRWNHLNPVPIQRVCERWVSRHVARVATAMSRLKDLVEDEQRHATRGAARKRDTNRPEEGHPRWSKPRSSERRSPATSSRSKSKPRRSASGKP